MCGKQAPPGLADTFELLSARWQAEHRLDPRLVGAWSVDATGSGPHDLVCETRLPAGVEAEVPPPADKRIAISGRFLDETRIRMDATAFLSFPVEHHRGEIGGDGVVTIHTRLPTVVTLFAEGLLPPVGGPPVEVMVGGEPLGAIRKGTSSCSSFTHPSRGARPGSDGPRRGVPAGGGPGGALVRFAQPLLLGVPSRTRSLGPAARRAQSTSSNSGNARPGMLRDGRSPTRMAPAAS